MKGIRFENVHTYEDYSLILLPYEIQSPTIKKVSVSIEGADGELDLTDYFGDANFNNRALTFPFQTKLRGQAFQTMFSNLANTIHGQKLRVILDDEPDYYYYGRVELDAFRSSSKLGELVISVDADPYKYKLYETVVSEIIVNSKSVNFSNLRKQVVPVITTSASINVSFNSTTYALTAGTWTIPEIVFKRGTNTILFTGNATITVRYQEGGL